MNRPLIYLRKAADRPIGFYDALQLILNPSSEDFHRIPFNHHIPNHPSTRMKDPLLQQTLIMCNDTVIFLCHQKKEKQQVRI